MSILRQPSMSVNVSFHKTNIVGKRHYMFVNNIYTGGPKHCAIEDATKLELIWILWSANQLLESWTYTIVGLHFRSEDSGPEAIGGTRIGMKAEMEFDPSCFTESQWRTGSENSGCQGQ
ncbi:hypothetical protein AVEN_266315-1 [Araneus ventricosus]|uniref:Uncharacterized protein n=1 Tax=Araneus ventricosus TaxID=182803 RepID=A0A4Y2PQW1_ARAVE|nr:hypothetical protein AVEN_266315-1 [Araneus ventricosus]